MSYSEIIRKHLPVASSYLLGGRTRLRFVPPIFLTVPPTPTLRMAFAALAISFCGTWSTFCGAWLFFRRRAAAFNPAAEPLRSTSVALPPPLVRASRRCLPGKETSVFPLGPAARLLARRCADVSGISPSTSSGDPACKGSETTRIKMWLHLTGVQAQYECVAVRRPSRCIAYGPVEGGVEPY